MSSQPIDSLDFNPELFTVNPPASANAKNGQAYITAKIDYKTGEKTSVPVHYACPKLVVPKGVNQFDTKQPDKQGNPTYSYSFGIPLNTGSNPDLAKVKDDFELIDALCQEAIKENVSGFGFKIKPEAVGAVTKPIITTNEEKKYTPTIYVKVIPDRTRFFDIYDRNISYKTLIGSHLTCIPVISIESIYSNKMRASVQVKLDSCLVLEVSKDETTVRSQSLLSKYREKYGMPTTAPSPLTGTEDGHSSHGDDTSVFPTDHDSELVA